MESVAGWALGQLQTVRWAHTGARWYVQIESDLDAAQKYVAPGRCPGSPRCSRWRRGHRTGGRVFRQALQFKGPASAFDASRSQRLLAKLAAPQRR